MRFRSTLPILLTAAYACIGCYESGTVQQPPQNTATGTSSEDFGAGHTAADDTNAAAPAGPNLLLISIDTLRADHLGCYGYDRPTSPTIDRLAAEGLVFADASTTSPWTLPSHASMLTGLYPRRHGLRLPVNTFPQARMAAHKSGVETRGYKVGQTTLAECLSAAGYATAAFVNFTLVSERYGFDRGFVRFRHIENDPSSPDPSAVAEKAVAWLKQPPDKPFFLFLHFYDVHSPYRSLPEYEARFFHEYDGFLYRTGRFHFPKIMSGEYVPGDADVQYLEDLYDAAIRQLDDGLADIVATLDETGLLDETLIVLTSDHGEQFMDHGSLSHGENHYQEVMRVPWIMRGPGIAAGRRIESMVSLIDLMPTVLDVLQVPSPPGLDGLNVAPTWQDPPGELVPRSIFAEAELSTDFQFKPGTFDVKKAVRDARFKLHHDASTNQRELYDLLADPGETSNLAETEKDVSDRLMRELEAFMSAPATSQPSAPLTSEQMRSLKSVGYVD